MKNPTTKDPQWFYTYEFVQFEGFVYYPPGVEPEHEVEYQGTGPYATFEECRDDAEARFECDRDMARDSLRAVRQSRKTKIIKESLE